MLRLRWNVGSCIAIIGISALGWIAFRRVRNLMMLGYLDSAIGRVRAVLAAKAEFAKTNPQVGYTCTLSQLPSDQALVRLRRDGRDNGYAFEITGCGLAQPHSTYHITARP